MGNNSVGETTIRCINLLDLRQSKHNLPPIVDPLRFLTGVTFQIDRLELLMFGELGFKITKIGDFVIIHLSQNESMVRVHPPDDRDMPRVDSPKTPRDYVNVKHSLCEVFGYFRYQRPAIWSER